MRRVDIDDLKMESIRADAEEEHMQHVGRYWSKERRADELYFGEGMDDDYEDAYDEEQI